MSSKKFLYQKFVNLKKKFYKKNFNLSIHIDVILKLIIQRASLNWLKFVQGDLLLYRLSPDTTNFIIRSRISFYRHVTFSKICHKLRQSKFISLEFHVHFLSLLTPSIHMQRNISLCKSSPGLMHFTLQ